LKIALIGLGKMGGALARRLLKANLPLTVFNRTAAKAQPFSALGANIAITAAAAVAEADIVISSLLDDDSVMQTVQGPDGFLSALKPGAIHVGTSTILPETSKKLSILHQQQGSIYIAGNVLGVPRAADQGELTTLVAGNQQAIEKCRPIFNAYSHKILNVGDQAYLANVVKISANYLLASSIEAMGEIYTFAEKHDADPAILNTLFHSIFAHPAFKLYADKIKDRSFDEVNFDLKGGFKDLHLFQKAFTDVQVVPAIADIIKNKFTIALALGYAAKDWSFVTQITRKQAGLE
jgi:3-hydroxyisobutyrate dehydrogenase-like beta-hydroxyacid dehydrogenase